MRNTAEGRALRCEAERLIAEARRASIQRYGYKGATLRTTPEAEELRRQADALESDPDEYTVPAIYADGWVRQADEREAYFWGT